MYEEAINKCQYKCTCFRTLDEGKLKRRQQIINENPDEYKQAMKNPETKAKMEQEIDEKLAKSIDQNEIAIKKDVVPNIEKFEKIIRKLAVIARSNPTHKYCLVVGLRQLENVVAVTV